MLFASQHPGNALVCYFQLSGCIVNSFKSVDFFSGKVHLNNISLIIVEMIDTDNQGAGYVAAADILLQIIGKVEFRN